MITLPLSILYFFCTFTKKYRDSKKEFEKTSSGFKGSQSERVIFELFLFSLMKDKLDRLNLRINDEDYMGAIGYSLYSGDEKVKETFYTENYTAYENMFLFVRRLKG